MKILIVDDNPTNRKLLRVTLEAEGFTTLEAADGLEALAALAQQPVEAVISDILMPRMDGFRLCQELRKNERFGHLPFIIYSATYTSPGDEKLALDSGADHYLRKPCPSATMVAALQQAAAKAKTRGHKRPSPPHPLEVMREYNEALVRKLEEKNEDLERGAAELRQQREWLQVTLASIGDGVIATDTAGRVTFLNPVAEKLTGWKQPEALGRPIQDVFRIVTKEPLPGGAPDDVAPTSKSAMSRVSKPAGRTRSTAPPTGRSATPASAARAGEAAASRQQVGKPALPAEDIVGRVLREGGVVELANHTDLVSRDGHEIQIEDSAAPIKDSAGNLAGVVVVFHDVTDKRRAQQALRASEERLRLLVEGTKDWALFMLDPEGRITTWNEGARRFKGYEAGEVIGQPFSIFYTPEDVTAGKPARELETALSEGRYEEEGERVRKDGSRFWASVLLTPLRDEQGRLRGFSKLTRDITARKQAEEELFHARQRLEAVMQAVPVGISFSDDPTCQRITGNPAVLAQFEVTPQDNLSASAPDASAPGRQVRFFRDGQPVTDAELPLQRAVAENQPIPPVELEVVLPSGRRWFSEASGAPIRDRQGNVIGGVAVTLDITARKRAEEKLRQFNTELERRVAEQTAEIAQANEDLEQRVATRTAELQTTNEALAASRRAALNLMEDAVEARRQAEQSNAALRESQQRLRRAHDELEQQVAQRTAELRRTNQTLRMISECNQALVHVTGERELIQKVCQIIHQVGGYPMARVVFAEPDEAGTVRPIAAAGFDDGYLERVKISWADTELGRGPTGTAIRTGTVCIGENFLTDPSLAPWREQALQHGFRSSIALPLRAAGRVFGALTIYASEPGFFTAAQAGLLGELADDLAFGIAALRAHRERDEALSALHETNQALAKRMEQLRGLALELTQVEERERRQLAAVLHDNLQQLLVSAKLNLEILRKRNQNPALGDIVQQLVQLLNESIQISRSLTLELSPPVLYEGGLVPALEWLGRWMQEKHHLKVHVKVDAQASPDEEEIRILLFQSVRELLFNVVKHAGVTTAWVEIGCPATNQVQVIVSDQGAGFIPARRLASGASTGGFGLFSIRERLELLGGRMEIRSAPGSGSRFTLVAPRHRLPPFAEAPSPASDAPRKP